MQRCGTPCVWKVGVCVKFFGQSNLDYYFVFCFFLGVFRCDAIAVNL
jgi:hypothetical protein